MKGSLLMDNGTYGRVQMALRNISSQVPDNARKTMRRVSERIVRLAKNYAPEDSAALVNSIRAEYSYGARGRLQVDLLVGGLPGLVERFGRMVDLDQYARIIHEHYEDMLVYGPGPRTEEKMAQFPGKVGSGFLTRAYQEEAPLLERDLIAETQAIVRKENAK